MFSYAMFMLIPSEDSIRRTSEFVLLMHLCLCLCFSFCLYPVKTSLKEPGDPTVRAFNSDFHGTKPLRIFLLPLDGTLIHCNPVFSQVVLTVYMYSFILIGQETSNTNNLGLSRRWIKEYWKHNFGARESLGTKITLAFNPT